MEKRIYGPDGSVARRIVQSGGSASTVYKDTDSRKTLIHTVMDAEPALRAAKQARDQGGVNFGGGKLQGYIPQNDYHRLVKEAKKEAQAAGGGYAEIWERKKNAYFRQNSYLRA